MYITRKNEPDIIVDCERRRVFKVTETDAEISATRVYQDQYEQLGILLHQDEQDQSI